MAFSESVLAQDQYANTKAISFTNGDVVCYVECFAASPYMYIVLNLKYIQVDLQFVFKTMLELMQCLNVYQRASEQLSVRENTQAFKRSSDSLTRTKNLATEHCRRF